MPGDNYLNGTSFISKSYIGDMTFAGMEGDQMLEESAGNYSAQEQVTSAYLRFDQRLGQKTGCSSRATHGANRPEIQRGKLDCR